MLMKQQKYKMATDESNDLLKAENDLLKQKLIEFEKVN